MTPEETSTAAITPDTINFILGALTAIVIPSTLAIYRYIKKKYETWRIKKMIFAEYVNPMSDWAKRLDMLNVHDYIKEVSTILKRLDYLLEKEIKYLNSENQFEIIRMIEYTKMYLYRVDEIIKSYSFTDFGESLVDIGNKPDKIKELTQIYKETLNDYMELKRDRLV